MQILRQPHRAFLLASTFMLILLVFSGQLWINQSLQEALQDPGGVSSQIWILAVLQIMVILISESLIFLFAFSFLFLHHLKPTLNHTPPAALWNQLMIELVRSWGHVLRGFLLFIIPGLIRYTQLFFVPFIVAADPRYWEGKVDALAESKRLMKTLPFHSWFLVIILKISLPLCIGLLSDGADQFWITPAVALALVSLELVFILVTTAYLFRLFQRQEQKLEQRQEIKI